MGGIAGCLADAGAKVMIVDIGVDSQDSGDWWYALADEADLDEAEALAQGDQAALPHLEAADNASMVNTASIAGKRGYPKTSAYRES